MKGYLMSTPLGKLDPGGISLILTMLLQKLDCYLHSTINSELV